MAPTTASSRAVHSPLPPMSNYERCQSARNNGYKKPLPPYVTNSTDDQWHQTSAAPVLGSRRARCMQAASSMHEPPLPGTTPTTASSCAVRSPPPPMSNYVRCQTLPGKQFNNQRVPMTSCNDRSTTRARLEERAKRVLQAQTIDGSVLEHVTGVYRPACS
ncbi:hypothetical protein EXIGLDRAFT_696284 [Exidia glandulosa HHB12029]|uniref:Uncharacterized protein n=1 Tax=Exidia glandulosa HHB12029 TaxID=1314781 RepID=A0A165FFA7_EXIGL|nr:hypothetical protein EXIGLDRAFT_696284 [Exidia glandulosa HHB12029]